MKNISTFLENKSKKIDVQIELDDFGNDLYNTLTDLLFNYNQSGQNISKSEFEKHIKNFIDKFYE